MTELVNIVRTADALLLARAQVDDALRTVSGHLFHGRRLTSAATKLEAALTSIERGTKLAEAGAIGEAQTQAVRDAATAVRELRSVVGGTVQDVRSGYPATRTALDAAHTQIVGLLDDATIPADAQVAATWTRAAKLVREGVELPPYLRDTARANVDALPARNAADVAPTVMRARIDEMTAMDLLQLSRLVRASRDVVPTLPALTEGQVKQLERASRLVEQGIDLPANWSLRPALEESRGRTIWRTLGDARDHARELLWGPRHELGPLEIDDLRAIARLPDDLRPEAFPAGLPAGPVPEALLREMRSGFADAKTIEIVRGHLHRVATDFASKLSQKKVQNYMDVLEPLRDELKRFQDLPLETADQHLAAGALELVEKNILRQEGKLGGGYGTWTDLAELGRINANLTTVDAFAAARQKAAEAAERAAQAQVVDDAARAEGVAPQVEKLTW